MNDIVLSDGLKLCNVIAITLMSLFISSACVAGSASVSVNINGSITVPTCKFNFGKALNIEFNDVDITKIASEQYRRPINLKISCGAQNAYVNFYMEAQAGGGTDRIKTTIDGLDIKIFYRRVNSYWSPGVRHITRTNDDQTLDAILVADPKVKLKGGDFSSSITLSATYL